MKSTLQFIAILLAISFLSSCSDDGKSVSEVKLIPVKSGKYFQYIDNEGGIVINSQFSEATIFRNGLALVKTSGDEPRWGFISEDGKYVIAENYKSATVFSDDLAWVVSENAAPTAINSKGEIKVILQDAETVKIFKEGLSAFSIIDSSGVKWGFIDNAGKVKINTQFSNTGNFSNGKCAVENSEGKWGYIDKEGKLLINYQFENAKDFVNDKAVVFWGRKAGLIDKTGKYVINPQFSDMVEDGDKYLIEQDNKWGWCDKDGKIIINPQFEHAFRFTGNDLAAVQSGESWGYIDIDGKIAINPQFDMALPYSGKIALVESGRKVGFIDVEGKYIINPQFDHFSADLGRYLCDGNSGFESVETDFFNIPSIVNRVNINTPEGLLLSSTLSDVGTKFKMSVDDFSKYSTEHMAIENEKITNDASVSFYVYANAFKDEPDGWYSKKVFNLDAVVGAYTYEISLSGRGYGKGEAVISAFEGQLSGYKKEEVDNPDVTVYRNKNKEVILRLSQTNNIWIHIMEVISIEEPNREEKQTRLEEKFPTNTYAVATQKRVYFHSKPDNASKLESFIISGQFCTVEKVKNDFGYVSFVYKNKTTRGWLNLKHLEPFLEDDASITFNIKIKDGKNNINVRRKPIDGSVIGKASENEIFTVTNLYKSETPIYLLNKKMVLTDIKSGEKVEKPKNFKLSNVVSSDDETYSAEVVNLNKTTNKVYVKKSDIEISYSNWYYLPQLNGWIYSEFCEKIN